MEPSANVSEKLRESHYEMLWAAVAHSVSAAVLPLCAVHMLLPAHAESTSFIDGLAGGHANSARRRESPLNVQIYLFAMVALANL